MSIKPHENRLGIVIRPPDLPIRNHEDPKGNYVRILQWILPVIVLAAAHSARSGESTLPDRQIVSEIARIRAVDNHCHDDPADVARGANWNKSAPLGTSVYPDVAPLSRGNPEWIRAWRALYGYRHSDMQPVHLQELLKTKTELKQRMGEEWPRYVLDKSGIDVALVNATQIGAGQRNARFRLVPYADSMLWPFSGEEVRLGFNGPGGSIAQLFGEAGMSSPPATLEAYETRFLDPTIRRWKAAGIIAVKFMVAYARSLDFTVVDQKVAAEIYSRAANGSALTPAENKSLEDYLFGSIAERAGAVGLVVHIHTGNGNGPYFNNSNANPGLLEPVIGSAALRRTKFVLVHGGWPFHLTAQAMMDKPNTYVDFSAQTFYLTPQALAGVLRGWARVAS